MADGLGGAGATPETEQFIFKAQKSTNQLKALLAKLLPAAGGGHGAVAECSSSAIDALLSDITDSLSQAMRSMRICAVRQPLTTGITTTTGWRSAGQSSREGGAGVRRLAPRRSGEGSRMASARMIVLQNGFSDSYIWRKYGEKRILGARFPRSYYKCGSKSGCPARKQVQQSDADPSMLEHTYFQGHTCDNPPPPSSSHVPDPAIGSDDAQRNTSSLPVPVTTAIGLLPLPVAAIPAAALPSVWYDPVPDVTACTPSLEQEQADLLLIPSPACSQSELLPVDAVKFLPHGLPLPLTLEHTTACDFIVPEL